MVYTELAHLMGKHPDVAIFRRFSALNAKNLLYLQAELVDLEASLFPTTEKEIEDNKVYERNWRKLSSSKDKKWDTFLEIRAKLKEYNEALYQQVTMSGLGKPNKNDLRFLQEWMTTAKSQLLLLTGKDRSVWTKGTDLIALQPRKQTDFFSEWVTNWFINWFYRKFVFKGDEENPPALLSQNEYVNAEEAALSRELQDQYVDVSQNKLLWTANLISTVISSVLPVVSIIVLYFVHSVIARLGIVAGFTALFAFTLVVVTDSRRVEVFTATAGFAAVQVVFVGSTSLSDS